MADQMTRRGPGRISVGLLGAAVAVLVLLAAGSVQAATVTVAAINYEFQPASRTVAVGDVVRWTFAGDPHSVTSGVPGSPDGRFDSGIKDPGGSFQFKFVTAGTYRYYCQVHAEQMFGTLVVKAASTPKPTVRSTPRPTPQPTARPTVRPASTPTPTATQATPEPARTPTPTAAPSVSARTSPVASETAGASLALLETPLPSSVPASPGPGAVAPTSAIDPAPIVAVLVILGILVGGGLIVARRRRVT